MNLMTRRTFGLLACAGTLLAAVPGHAQLKYHVDVNTSALTGANPSAPFSLDFQLSNGSGDLTTPNAVTLSNFTFGGGNAVGAATATAGAGGSLSGTVTLTDTNSILTELFQQFTPGSTLGFDVSQTTNVKSPTPDAFSFAILDNSLANIPTTGLGDSLLLVNIDNPSPGFGDIQTFSSTSPAGVTVVAVPEANSFFAVGGLLMASAGSLRWRKQRK